jgi:pimeloyl-ACP methyl ester carboxylesterase
MLSGMGADARVFEKQIEAIPEIVVPAWIDPLPRESLASYAERLANKINPGRACFVGGASFGGFVALEMIRHLDVIACFLVGSVRSPEEFPKAIKTLRRLSGVADATPFEVATLLSKAALLSSGTVSSTHLSGLLRQMSESDASFLRWACRAVLEWHGIATANTPIYQIHGANDIVLPVKNTTPDVIVAGAGHALSMSHPDEVTEFLITRTRC